MKNVLIVDDSRSMRMIVRRTLKDAGFTDIEVAEAGNGQEALGEVKKQVPDVILCDWNMPTMTGIQFLRSLRKQGITVPFGFVTSEGTDEMMTEAKEAGANFHIVKPFNPEKFQEHLTPILN